MVTRFANCARLLEQSHREGPQPMYIVVKKLAKITLIMDDKTRPLNVSGEPNAARALIGLNCYARLGSPLQFPIYGKGTQKLSP